VPHRDGGRPSPLTVFPGAAKNPSRDRDSSASRMRWFERAVREMAHDQPLDVALRIASPDSLIAADTDLLQLTAVRQWTLALSEQLRKQSMEETFACFQPPERLRQAGAGAVFDAESGGAAQVVSWSGP